MPSKRKISRLTYIILDVSSRVSSEIRDEKFTVASCVESTLKRNHGSVARYWTPRILMLTGSVPDKNDPSGRIGMS